MPHPPADQDPDVSIVVPAHGADRTLAPCIDSLLTQRFRGTFEVVVIASGDTAQFEYTAADPRLRLLRHQSRLYAPAARNRGAQVARGRLLAFTDADVLAHPDWLDHLVQASAGRRAAAGSITNGTPRSPIGTAEYLMCLLDLHPARPARTAWHGATGNLLIPRELWRTYGPFPEDLGGGEDTLLTSRLRQDGLFVFVPEARVAHLNRTRLGPMLAHQLQSGRFAARVARRPGYYKAGSLLRHPLLAPIAALGRLVSLYARLVAWSPDTLVWAVALLPVVVTGAAAWAAGLAAEGLLLAGPPRIHHSPISRPSKTGGQ